MNPTGRRLVSRFPLVCVGRILKRGTPLFNFLADSLTHGSHYSNLFEKTIGPGLLGDLCSIARDESKNKGPLG
jgi:hypothetical protein